MRDTLVLQTHESVIRALVTYTDWWQPSSSSVLQVGGARRSGNEHSDGLRSGLLDTLDERTELCRRVQTLEPRDRSLLFLWYVRQLPVDEIASEVRISRRQCFRRRSAAVHAIVALGEPVEAA
ncbi:MAG TPA: hypothetical protein VH989_03900 [Actinomycetota bacterium]